MNHILPSILTMATISLSIPQVLHAEDPAKPGCKGACPLKERILKRFDTNQNGVLDPDEKAAAQQARAEHRQKLLDRFDTNGDGTLDETERQAAKATRGGHLRGHKHGAQAAPATAPQPK